MISDKVRDFADQAGVDKNICYGYAEKLVELVLDDVLTLIEHTNLTEKTFTTFDRDMATFCRMKIMENIINEYRR